MCTFCALPRVCPHGLPFFLKQPELAAARAPVFPAQPLLLLRPLFHQPPEPSRLAGSHSQTCCKPGPYPASPIADTQTPAVGAAWQKQVWLLEDKAPGVKQLLALHPMQQCLARHAATPPEDTKAFNVHPIRWCKLAFPGHWRNASSRSSRASSNLPSLFNKSAL